MHGFKCINAHINKKNNKFYLYAKYQYNNKIIMIENLDLNYLHTIEQTNDCRHIGSIAVIELIYSFAVNSGVQVYMYEDNYVNNNRTLDDNDIKNLNIESIINELKIIQK